MIRVLPVAPCSRLVLAVLLLIATFAPIQAQSPTLEQSKQRVEQLVKEVKYTEALPLLEKILAAEPTNGKMHFYHGFALLAEANKLQGAAKSSTRIRAREGFLKAKANGYDEPIVDALIHALPPDGSDSGAYSDNVEADALMKQAEIYFGGGKLDEALVNYQKALKLDPNLYHAALYSGDVFTHRGDFTQAEFWYQKAISIDPTRETAYRYSATPLMKQGKHAEALDRYIEAFITEPYSRFARAGFIQWGQVTGTSLAHPEIAIPTNVTFDAKGDANISLDASALMGKDDGSFAWISYGATRSTWRKEKFAKTFPSESKYRHSLAEEADALRSVVTLAATDKRVKQLTPSLTMLKRLNDEGLLEAYILLARPSDGISQDYPSYVKHNRAKLRQYVKNYVVRKQ